MAKIEYKAECLCGGQIKTVFKKPTRFEPTIAKANCQDCGSEFMFTFSVEYASGQRAYVPEHKVLHMTPELEKAVRERKKQPKEVSA